MPNTTAGKFRQELETWKKDHDIVMEYWELQGEVTRRLELFSRVRAVDERWTRDVQDGTQAFDEEMVRVLHGFYEDWHDESKDVLKRIERVERLGHAVVGASDHTNACQQAKAVASLSVDETISALKPNPERETRSLQEVLDGLRNKGKKRSAG